MPQGSRAKEALLWLVTRPEAWSLACVPETMVIPSFQRTGPDRRVGKQAIRERAAGCGQAASSIMAFIFVSTSSATSARAGEAERAERSLVGNAVAILVWPFSS